jgi:iduronate 2-sulfatase
MPAISRRKLLKKGLLAGAYAVLSPGIGQISRASTKTKQRPNVLFIAVDDLRPQLGCYGTPNMITPNIDALAGQGTVFLRTYCQQAVCNPSRASLLTGLRPDSTQIYDLKTHFRYYRPDVVTLPQHFKQNGYHTQGLSKIFHGRLDDPQSWSAPHWGPRASTYVDEKIRAKLEEDTQAALTRGQVLTKYAVLTDPDTGLALKLSSRKAVHGPVWEGPDCPDNRLGDGKTAEKAIELLNEYKDMDQPFFLGVGFVRPHLPFVAPKKYFDLYPLESIPLAENQGVPEGAPDCAFPSHEEPRVYIDVPEEGPIPEAKQREIIRAYCACASYIDALVGRIIAELDRLGLREDTVICLWGDHGWHLGENSVWGKMTNFEESAHAPLIISAPQKGKKGGRTTGLAEFVDIYPTLCQLCGLSLPQGLEGTSLVPLMEDPVRPWKKAAFSQDNSRRNGIMGYTMRTDRYRYTEWLAPNKRLAGRELYDHKTDPGENINLAVRSGNEKLVERLSEMLHAGWKSALPVQ